MPRTDHIPPVGAVSLHPSQGHYIRYVLRPSGNNADMSYTDELIEILNQRSFQDPNRLEWRLKSGISLQNVPTLTVHDENDDLLTDFLKAGSGLRETYSVVLQYVGAVEYDLEVDLMDGADQVVLPLAKASFKGAPNTMDRMAVTVTLRS